MVKARKLPLTNVTASSLRVMLPRFAKPGEDTWNDRTSSHCWLFLLFFLLFEFVLVEFISDTIGVLNGSIGWHTMREAFD